MFGLAAEVQHAQGSNCSESSFLYATSETKLELTRFFDNLTRKHSKWLSAFEDNKCIIFFQCFSINV